MSFSSRFRLPGTARDAAAVDPIVDGPPTSWAPAPFDAVLEQHLDGPEQHTQPPTDRPGQVDESAPEPEANATAGPVAPVTPSVANAGQQPGRSSLFWDLYDRVASSAELFSVPATAISVVVGELEASIPVIRQSYQRHWGDACDIYVLTDRPFVPGQPDWNVVGTPSEMVSILDEGSSHFPLLVLDVPRELPVFVRPLIQRLRGAGVGMVRYVLNGDPSDEDLATWFGELGRPSVLDLATPVGTDRIVDLLDRGEPVVSVAGMPITTELLLAIKLDQERIS